MPQNTKSNRIGEKGECDLNKNKSKWDAFLFHFAFRSITVAVSYCSAESQIVQIFELISKRPAKTFNVCFRCGRVHTAHNAHKRVHPRQHWSLRVSSGRHSLSKHPQNDVTAAVAAYARHSILCEIAAVERWVVIWIEYFSFKWHRNRNRIARL